ncbi:hypothetical protein ElyMa_000542700 [Elysia marginata]|uniref:BZIP domain-containing protein n=1 Tax=Elysia marginata TaxID=1093978 RepID=A0AAV4FZX1_9GAST|nr:hypothetical protein ElyMa_000542700 [Elysia marginata]
MEYPGPNWEHAEYTNNEELASHHHVLLQTSLIRASTSAESAQDQDNSTMTDRHTRSDSRMERSVLSVNSYPESCPLSVEQSEPDSFMYLSSDCEEPMSIEHYANVGADDSDSCWAVPSKPRQLEIYRLDKSTGFVGKYENKKILESDDAMNEMLLCSHQLPETYDAGMDHELGSSASRPTSSRQRHNSLPNSLLPGKGLARATDMISTQKRYASQLSKTECTQSGPMSSDLIINGDWMLPFDTADRERFGLETLSDFLREIPENSEAASKVYNEMPKELLAAIDQRERELGFQFKATNTSHMFKMTNTSNMTFPEGVLSQMKNIPSTSMNGHCQRMADPKPSRNSLFPSGASNPTSPNFLIFSGSYISPARERIPDTDEFCNQLLSQTFHHLPSIQGNSFLTPSPTVQTVSPGTMYTHLTEKNVSCAVEVASTFRSGPNKQGCETEFQPVPDNQRNDHAQIATNQGAEGEDSPTEHLGMAMQTRPVADIRNRKRPAASDSKLLFFNSYPEPGHSWNMAPTAAKKAKMSIQKETSEVAPGGSSLGEAPARRDILQSVRSKVLTKCAIENKNLSVDPEHRFKEPVQLTETEQATIQRRRDSNKVSARRSRARKQQEQQDLEQELRDLQQQNSQWHQKLKQQIGEIHKSRRYLSMLGIPLPATSVTLDTLRLLDHPSSHSTT